MRFNYIKHNYFKNKTVKFVTYLSLNSDIKEATCCSSRTAHSDRLVGFVRREGGVFRPEYSFIVDCTFEDFIWCYSMLVIQLIITDIFGCKYEISLLFYKKICFIKMYNLHDVLDFPRRVADACSKIY
jgi:hypothetical protein